jgi:hypothetical protein
MENNIIFKQGLTEINEQDMSHIQEVVRLFPNLSRQELARTLCEHLSWYSPSGASKVKSCLTLLEHLAVQNLIVLPKKATCIRLSPDKPPQFTPRTEQKPLLEGSLKEYSPISLKILHDKESVLLWNEYVQRYHPLKYRRPFGNWLRYFLMSDNKPLGCLLISGAAKTLHHRDHWINWSVPQRRRNLSWVINNSRYLIFPWVQIPHLASHVLGQLTRRVATDWEDRWGYRPVLMETFVDPQRYSGTCYKAAGWQNLGLTTGEGHYRSGKQRSSTPKHIFVKPLDPQFRTLLCSEQLQGRIIE